MIDLGIDISEICHLSDNDEVQLQCIMIEWFGLSAHLCCDFEALIVSNVHYK